METKISCNGKKSNFTGEKVFRTKIKQFHWIESAVVSEREREKEGE